MSLKAGALVSVLVRERLGPELYRVSIGPRLLTASSATLLEPGTLLKARVERAGDSLILRIGSGDGLVKNRTEALPSAISPSSMPNDAAAQAAAAALLREGVAPEPRSLSRVRRALLREAAEGGELGDLAARMEAKGLAAETTALDGLERSYAFAEPREGFGGSGGEAPAEGRDGEGRGGSGPPPLELQEAELPRVLADLIRSLLTRTSGGTQSASSLSLALFNHLRGPQGSWVIVPFHFALDAIDFAGSFRIQLPYVRAGQGLFDARFSASRGPSSEDWSFFLNFGGGQVTSLRIQAPKGKIGRSSKRFAELADGLSSLACSLRFSDEIEGERAGARGSRLDLDA
jgi:hypothetical protein